MSTKYIDGTFMRTARKAHRCEECGRTIAAGERYAEYVGETPVYQSGHRYCLDGCADKQLAEQP